jgi:hypothetical protein
MGHRTVTFSSAAAIFPLFTLHFSLYFIPLQQTFRKTKAEMNNNNTDPTPCPSP